MGGRQDIFMKRRGEITTFIEGRNFYKLLFFSYKWLFIDFKEYP